VLRLIVAICRTGPRAAERFSPFSNDSILKILE